MVNQTSGVPAGPDLEAFSTDGKFSGFFYSLVFNFLVKNAHIGHVGGAQRDIAFIGSPLDLLDSISFTTNINWSSVTLIHT